MTSNFATGRFEKCSDRSLHFFAQLLTFLLIIYIIQHYLYNTTLTKSINKWRHKYGFQH